MLVLARKSGESIRIGDDIVVTVLDVRGQTVRLGFDAPKAVIILRTELEARAKQLEATEVPTAEQPVTQ